MTRPAAAWAGRVCLRALLARHAYYGGDLWW